MNKINLIIVIIASLFIKSGLSIKCYSCESSNENDQCHNLPKDHTIVAETCSVRKMGHEANLLKDIVKIDYFQSGGEIDVPMVCQKIVATVDKNKKLTYRGCQLHSGKTDPCAITKGKANDRSDIKIDDCSVCDQDLCNSTNKLYILSPSLLFISFLIIFFKLFS